MNSIAELDERGLLVFVEALTPREMEILILLAEDGRSNFRIGEKLYISERTVRSHLRIIMQKFGVNNRTQVVLTAQRLGLLDAPDSLTPVARSLLAFIRLYPQAYAELVESGQLPVLEIA
jgi:DNA-binding CsgD family transcriptional regulator